MNYSDSSFSGSTPQPKGCRTAIIVILVTVFLIIGTPFFLLWMIKPSHQQWTRVTEKMEARPYMDLGTTSSGIILEEEWLEFLISQGLTFAFQESDGAADFAGFNLTLLQDQIAVLAGAVIENPLSNKSIGPERINVAVEADFRVEVSRDSTLSARLNKIKIGKLTIPFSLLMKIQTLQSALNPKALSIPAIKNLDLKDQTVAIDLNEVTNEISPGLKVQYARILPGRINFTMTLPEVYLQEIRSFAALLSEAAPSLRERWKGEIPEEKVQELDDCESILASIAQEKAGDEGDSVLTSYLEGAVSSYTAEDSQPRDLDFGIRISEESTVVTDKNSYGEFILPGKSILKVMEKSEVYLETCQQEESQSAVALKLISGKIRAVVSNRKEEDVFTIQTGKALIDVRGTDFIIESFDQDRMKLTVAEGNVRVNGTTIVAESQAVSVEGSQISEVEDVDAEDLAEIFKQTPVYTDEKFAEALLQYNPLPSLIKLYSLYSEMWNTLSQEEQKLIQLRVEEYLEESPEFREKSESFLKKQGWTD